MELDGTERGVGWLSGPEAGLEAEENGSMEGTLCGLLPGAEAAMAVNLKTAPEQPAVRCFRAGHEQRHQRATCYLHCVAFEKCK